MTGDLDTLIRELDDVSARLRAGEMEAAEAAALVERCAELASRIGAEVDRVARASESEAPDDGQEQLL